MAPPSRQKSRKIPESFCEDLLPRKLAKEIFSKHELFRTFPCICNISAFNTSGKSYSNLKASKTNYQRFPGCDRKSSKASRKLRDRLTTVAGWPFPHKFAQGSVGRTCLFSPGDEHFNPRLATVIAPAIHTVGIHNANSVEKMHGNTLFISIYVFQSRVLATAQWWTCCHHDRLYQSHWSDDHTDILPPAPQISLIIIVPGNMAPNLGILDFCTQLRSDDTRWVWVQNYQNPPNHG